MKEIVRPQRALPQPKPGVASGGDCWACVIGGMTGLSVSEVYEKLNEGHKKIDLTLADRKYICSNCGIILDRDLNAALNLKKHGVDTFKPTKKRTQELRDPLEVQSCSADGVNEKLLDSVEFSRLL